MKKCEICKANIACRAVVHKECLEGLEHRIRVLERALSNVLEHDIFRYEFDFGNGNIDNITPGLIKTACKRAIENAERELEEELKDERDFI